jgi:hypothetical protein
MPSLARLSRVCLSPPRKLRSLASAVVIVARRALCAIGRICHKHLTMLSFMPVLALGGCSGSQVIDLYTADYRETGASSADAQLLQNILRAKDDLPIHFRDLSVIHGAIQGTVAAAASIPLAQNGSLTPTLLTPALSLQNSPTFDLGTLDTQEFTRGMLTPANPTFIKQLFDQGVDPRLLALLFISEVRDHEGHLLLNNTSCDPRKSKPGECYPRIYDFLREVNDVFSKKPLVHVNNYVALRAVGGPLTGAWSLRDNLDPLLKLDTAKFKLKGKQLYSRSDPLLAICKDTGSGHLRPLIPSPLGPGVCNKSEVIAPERTSLADTISPRSTYEIIQYLGQVLRFQQEKQEMQPNRCLVLGDMSVEKRRCDTGEVLFQVNAPAGTPAVATRYGDAWYALYDRHCNKEREEACDYSLQVLAILELLLNANKAAKDIPAIPRVQVVP